DVFAPVPFRKRIESFSAYEFDTQKLDRKEASRHVSTTAYPSTLADSASLKNETNMKQNTIEYSMRKPSLTTKTIQKKKKLTRRQYHRVPFAAFLYNFATKRYTDPNYEDKRTTFRGPFLADRWWDRMVVNGNDLKVAIPTPDGQLRINPDPGRLKQYYPHFNSMTIVCAQ
ncbi:unnamed protein product, partial [Onchocerca ochengi]